ncbi:MAG TPA: beta-ketoacyl synthase N-terminal-like domain-containing protein [Thermoanaerobaculia bacterium]|nr:beta-ketoacyl synthase N-terminal-like domain-containing protein [Thermoanaerobaculia bacterium]
MSAVAITGIGTVGAHGVGVEALLAALDSGGAPASAVERRAGHHRRGGARTALLARDLDLGRWLSAGQARRLSAPGRWTVVAGRHALEQAGLADAGPADHARTAVVVGTSFGPSSVTEALLSQILGSGPETASPALFTESVASASAAQLALALRARGPNLAVTQREASDLLALIEGVRLLATGAADRVLVTVVEEMIPLLHGALDRFRALATAGADRVERARPFDLRRDGMLAAEGAAALLLEPAAVAAARGAPALATVAATVRAFDPTASATDWGHGAERLASALRRGLERARVPVESIDLVLSGASGARRGDRLEAAVLGATFGPRMPPVTAAKGTTGEYGGAALAAAVLAAAGRARIPTRGFEAVDPELGLRPTVEPPPAPRRALVTALASGGAAAWLVLEAGQPSPAQGV